MTEPDLIARLRSLREALLSLEKAQSQRLEKIHPLHQASARNLLHYVALRSEDLRSLQEELVQYGLSSLGRCESHVLDNLQAVLNLLGRGTQSSDDAPIEAPVNFRQGRALLSQKTQSLFGNSPLARGANIMVTMPTEAADDSNLVHDLLASGMNCMRINCAHDHPEVWQGMIDNLRRAQKVLDRQCRVYMDLCGPKIRTGPMQEGPRIIKLRPKRDLHGRPIVAEKVWLTTDPHSRPASFSSQATLPVDGSLLKEIRLGESINFRDAAGRSRTLTVTQIEELGVGAESFQTAYVESGTLLERSGVTTHTGTVGQLPPQSQTLTLYPGDRLLVTSDALPGEPALRDASGQVLRPARIGCTLPSIFRDVRAGQPILFDDGRIRGVVVEIREQELEVEITGSQGRGLALRADKGINLPETDLHLEALTEKDLRDLDFVAQHAEVVGYSFVRRAEDVHRLQEELAARGKPDLGMVLKIENQQAFNHLPSLLLAAMRSPVVGVMIARGDLAVECGYQRLAELQEEILWMCEAAHLPVIWATQVLENLAKSGIPSRAEITDAAMSVRAECVMLNKGPYIVDAVRGLDDILRRMQDHQMKKRPLLRRLRLADDLLVR